MSREVRRVPKDWKHPVKEDGFTDVPLVEECMPDWPDEERTHYQERTCPKKK